jgi:hypothetical protein
MGFRHSLPLSDAGCYCGVGSFSNFTQFDPATYGTGIPNSLELQRLAARCIWGQSSRCPYQGVLHRGFIQGTVGAGATTTAVFLVRLAGKQSTNHAFDEVIRSDGGAADRYSKKSTNVSQDLAQYDHLRKESSLLGSLAFFCLWKSLGFPVILQLLPGCAGDRFASNCPRSSPRGLLPWLLKLQVKMLGRKRRRHSNTTGVSKASVE